MDSLKKMNGAVSGEAESNLKGDYMQTAEKISDAAKEATSSAHQAIKDIQDYCRENPGKAMGIAAGVGALVSLILIKSFSRNESANDQIVSGLLRKGKEAWNHLKSGIEPTLKNIKESIGE